MKSKVKKRAYQNIAGAPASSAYVRARHARRDSGDDFIRDRADLFGQVFGGDSQPVPFADQKRFVSKLDAGDVGHVNDRQIHAHAADDRGKMSAKENPSIIRMRAAQAVGVTYWERGDATFARGGERATVTERRPGGNRL